MGRLLLGRTLPWVAVGCALLLAHCGDSPNEPDPRLHLNRPPSVRITAGAATSDTSGVDYRVHFRWNGFDDDGVIERFQYALDDTVSEGAWRDTTGFGARLVVRAPLSDPAADTSSTGWHTFYVRAIDNDLGISEVDTRVFNARTIAPRSMITFPDLTGQVPVAPPSFVLRWTGEDLDSTRPGAGPVAYEYKLVRVPLSFDLLDALIDSLHAGRNLLLDEGHIGSRLDWIRVPEDIFEARMEGLAERTTYAFGLRAIDEAGAVEATFERGRNLVAFDVAGSAALPTFEVRSPGLGAHVFPNDGDIWDVSVGSGQSLRFSWTGSTPYAGSLVGQVNYALDVPDVADESIRDPRGIGGWIGWGPWRSTQIPFVFGSADAETVHSLWIKMRGPSNDPSTERVARIRMTVVGFGFEKLAAIFDGSSFPTRPPTDAVHDQFIDEFVVRGFLDSGDVDHIPTLALNGWGDPPRPILHGLEVYARYQHVVWHAHDAGYDRFGNPLYVNETLHRRLSTYAAAGGRLFFSGGRLSGHLLNDVNASILPYPRRHPDSPGSHFSKNGFLWNFLRMRNDIVSTVKDDPELNESTTLVGVRSLHPAFPDIAIDTAKWDPYEVLAEQTRYRGGLIDWEAVQEGDIANEPLEGLDSLYAPMTFDETLCCGETPSLFEDAVVGHRYVSTEADTTMSTVQGRTVVFNFPNWWMEPGPLAEASAAAVHWLMTGRDD